LTSECFNGAPKRRPNDQHRVLGEGGFDPGEGLIIEPRQIDPERLGAERLAQRAQLR
jgi:hypothetical protein